MPTNIYEEQKPMTNINMAKDEMNKALQRLETAIKDKLENVKDSNILEYNDKAATLNITNNNLEKENYRLKQANNISIEKLDITIANLNDILDKSQGE